MRSPPRGPSHAAPESGHCHSCRRPMVERAAAAPGSVRVRFCDNPICPCYGVPRLQHRARSVVLNSRGEVLSGAG